MPRRLKGVSGRDSTGSGNCGGSRGNGIEGCGDSVNGISGVACGDSFGGDGVETAIKVGTAASVEAAMDINAAVEAGVARDVEVAREVQTYIAVGTVVSVGEAPTVEAATTGLASVTVEAGGRFR